MNSEKVFAKYLLVWVAWLNQKSEDKLTPKKLVTIFQLY